MAPVPWTALFSVALGGAVGSSLRFAVSATVVQSGLAGAWATLVVNVVGSGLMGVLVSRHPDPASSPRLLLGAGLLGGFTTFSAFSAEVVALGPRLGTIYTVASVALGLAAFLLGRHLGSTA